MSKSKVLILGATGQVGGAVVPHLAANSDVEVVVATRSPEKWKTPDTTAVRLDLDQPETLARALEGVERAFLVTGYTVDMLRQSKDFLNAAKRAGVKYVVHLGACGDDDTRVDHYAWHQFIERYIEWCGFSFTHLRPEIFMQNLLGYVWLTAGKDIGADEVFDNFPAITGRQPQTVADFAKTHAAIFKY